ncbi:MAG TPA: hypothetical protein DGG95_17670, partial [Cytophagales bacterium]|nr:hypothetical protein [Cytophagales bacterium]
GTTLSWPSNTSVGSYTIQATNASTSCQSTMTGSASIVAMPAAFTVGGGGTICAGAAGLSITLSGSETGVNYQLKNGSTNIGSAKAGTGSALTWTANTATGTYAIVAANGTNATCTTTMTGNAVITVNPVPALFTLSGGGTICSSDPAPTLTLSGSETGVNYQLKKGSTLIGSAVAGTGGVLTWTSYTVSTGTFTVVGTNATTGCASTMTGSAIITVNALPTVYTVGGGTSYCAGGSGVSITLSNSQVGVNYQLKVGGTNAGSPLAGIGALLTWPNITTAGTYTVTATNATTNCTSNMTGSKVVTINPLPTIFNVTGATVCAGSSITVGLSGSTSGVNYQLKLNGTNLGAVKAGTGSALSWGTQTSTGTYTITATNATTACSQTMNGSPTIYPQPSVYTVSGGGTVCTGTSTTVTLSGSDIGVNYQLQLGGVDSGPVIAGTGVGLTWTLTAAGTYGVKATNANAPCIQMMTGTATITSNPLPLTYSVTGGGIMCPDSGTGLSFGLNGSTAGVNYQLQVNGSASGTPKAGTGLSLTWNNQTTAGTYSVVATIVATGCSQVMTGSPSISTDAVCSTLDNYAFMYKYDNQRRMIGKRVPGADWVYMVYDDRDRLVLTQDGNQRANNQWLFTKYDALNRPVSTGIYSPGGAVDQGTMQTNVTNYYNSLATNNGSWYESFSTGTGNVHFYDNKSFPNTATDPTQYLTVTYYDDNTTLQGLWGSNYTYINDNLSSGSYSQLAQDFRTVIGHPVGSKVKMLDGSNTWLYNIVFYDNHYRVIQTIADNGKGGRDRVSNLYDFVGKVVANKTTHMVGSASQQTVAETFAYDHAQRLTQTTHSVNGATPVLLLQNTYNEIGQLVTKSLGAQNVDYRYNIRGWLTSINNSQLASDGGITNSDPNDLFGMNLSYNDVVSGIGNLPQYNGNISAIKWSSNLALGTVKDVAYSYTYDTLNRIKSASYLTDPGVWTPSSNFAETGFGYDLNGNIRKLSRTNASGATMDALTYDYVGQGTSRGNQLKSVTDAGDITNGFTDGNTSGEDYSYDLNGNMTADKNKNISGITYNHLNLPLQVTKGTGEKMVYTYDASGRKLRQQVLNADGTTNKTTDYDGAFIYQNNVLQFINHEEGRVVMTGTSPEYQYHLKDHLGNVRMTFTTQPVTESPVATLEPANQAVEQSQFLRMDDARLINSTLFDHTRNGISNYSERLSGSTNEKTGIARSISVMPGDIIDLEVYAKYVDASNSNNTAALVQWLAQIAAGTASSGTVVDGPNYSTNGNTSFPYAGLAGEGNSSGLGPKAYLNYIMFDRNFNPILTDVSQTNYVRMSTVGREDGTNLPYGNPHERLSAHIVVKQPGYLYVYLSNEETGPVEVYFDDLRVTQTKSPVVQQEDFYPFGLSFNSYSRENSVPQNFLYNGKERMNDLSIDWYDYSARMYMPEIGRWGVVDPHTENYMAWSPYHYCANNPILLTDPTGMDWYQKKDKDGNVVDTKWQKGNDKMEGYENVGTNFTFEFTDFSISFEQNEAVEVTEKVLQPEDWETQGVGNQECYNTCVKISAESGAGHIRGLVNGMNFKHDTAEGKGDKVDPQTGKDYIDSQIDMGRPVIVGVDRSNDNDKKLDGDGDHYVIISSRTTNLRTGVQTYGFLDPGATRFKAGTDAKTNKFTVSSTGQLTSGYYYPGQYQVSWVGRNKGGNQIP